jgi:hypothetical protein
MTMRLITITSGVLVALTITFCCSLTATASADFGFTAAGTALLDTSGGDLRQAGSHPDFDTRIFFNRYVNPVRGKVEPDGTVRDVRVDLPVGMVGNPQAVGTCTADQLRPPHPGDPLCPLGSQIGTIGIIRNSIATGFDGVEIRTGLYNMVPESGEPAEFGFVYGGAPVKIVPEIRPTDFGISALSVQASQGSTIFAIDVSLWGVPAAHVHDTHRAGADPNDPSGNTEIAAGDGTPARPGPPIALQTTPRPFFSIPTSCAPTAQNPVITADSWEHPDRDVTSSASLDGTPFLFSGCEQLDFKPGVSAQPLAHVADGPTGLDVDVDVPQNDNPNALATAHVRRVAIRFPAGMSVSPSSAAGLGACSPAQIGLGTNDAPTCPDSSKIGSVQVATPLLADPLEGDVILAKQTDNPFSSLVALYMAIKGPGFYLKLPGRVDLDPVTGQVSTVFDNTPQLPFSKLHVRLRGGSQAPLAAPTLCGTYTSHVEVTSWATDNVVSSDDPMTVTEGCQARSFSPTLHAGVTTPVAGQDTSFNLTLTRPDQTQELAGVTAVLPKGLLAHIGSVPQCPEAQAAAATCDGASLIGHTSVLSGPGAAPLSVGGNVYLTGPYKGAPFGLSIVVPTAGQAGPFDLGNVVVRAALSVDPIDAHATVVSDPLPTIIQGIPLRLRQVTVTVDRPGFMINPTSCTPSQLATDLSSTEGAAATLAVPFSIGGCGGLALSPKLALALSGKGQTTDGKHPGVSATLTQPAGQANLKKVQVALPLSLALDPDNAQGLCEFVDGSKVTPTCPKASIVGTATAITPALSEPLSGPVYFVKNVRKDPKSGREIRTLPKLVIPLTGQNGLKLTLTGTSNVVDDRLVTTFDNIPDAPVSSFKLNIIGGKGGILVVSGADICKTTQIADQQVDGQNAKIAQSAVYIQTPSCSLKVLSKKTTKTSVSVKVAGLGAGKVTVTGHGIKKTSKTITKSTVATITAKRTKGKPGKVTVSFDPTGPAKVHKTTK